MNRSDEMRLFEDVHGPELRQAYTSLKNSPYISMWRIALREVMEFRHLDVVDDEPTMTIITVKLGKHGQLEAADKASELAVEEWQKRYAGENMGAFFAPLDRMIRKFRGGG